MPGVKSAVVDVLLCRSKPVREEYLAPDFDDEEKDATVSLYRKAMGGSSSKEGHSSKSGNVYHWALVVRFDDGSYRTLEGLPDKHILHAHYSTCLGDGLTELKELGRVRTSPAALRSIARQNRRNGRRYDLLDNSSQDWAIRAAKDISPSIGREASSVPRVAPLLGAVRDILSSPVNPIGLVVGLLR